MAQRRLRPSLQRDSFLVRLLLQLLGEFVRAGSVGAQQREPKAQSAVWRVFAASLGRRRRGTAMKTALAQRQ